MNKVLLHTCCAPCSVMCIEELLSEGISPSLFWFNPNIHPFLEYKMRKNTLMKYAQSLNLELILHGEYGLINFIKGVHPNFGNERCNYCYEVRLEETAKYAKCTGFKGFTTTLLISPYQDHEILKMIGERVSRKYDVEFLYRDFRLFFREGQKKSREKDFYMQKYCGCVFSEEERFKNY